MRAEIDDYLVQQSLSSSTKGSYRYYLLKFAAWMDSEGKALEDLSGADFVRWLESHPGWGSASRNMAVCSIRGFVRWQCGESHPLLRVKVKRQRDPGPQRTLTAREARTLLDYLEHGTQGDAWRPTFVRNLALVSLDLDCGFRASEVVGLELEHLDLEARTVSVRVKGGRWGQGVFSETTRLRLERWLELRPAVARPETTTLFVGIGGLKPGTPLTRHGLRALMHYMALNTGLKRFSPHSLRRSMAVLSIENGASTRLTQLAGRWKSLLMVETYTRTLTAESFADRYSPVEGLGIPVDLPKPKAARKENVK